MNKKRGYLCSHTSIPIKYVCIKEGIILLFYSIILHSSTDFSYGFIAHQKVLLFAHFSQFP